MDLDSNDLYLDIYLNKCGLDLEWDPPSLMKTTG